MQREPKTFNMYFLTCIEIVFQARGCKDENKKLICIQKSIDF